MQNGISEAARASFLECASVWQFLVEDFNGSLVETKEGLAVRWANNPFAFWNTVFLTDELPDVQCLRDRLRAALSFIRGQSQPGFLLLSRDFLGGAAAISDLAIAEEGFAFSLSFRGMVGDARRFSPGKPPEDLEMRRVTDDALLEVYARLNCEAYGLPPSIASGALSPVWKEAFSYVGFAAGEPVCTASAFPHEGSLYVGLVATREESRRRGHGEAALRHAVEQARAATGITRTTLHATDPGYPIYLRLGYEPVATIGIYHPQA